MAVNPAQERLRTLRIALRDLHKALLDTERLVYEKAFGRIGSDFYLLQLASEDPQFAWLRALSAEMIRLDGLVGRPDEPSNAEQRLFGARVRALLVPGEPATGFQRRYQLALQEHPAVIMAHAAVMQSLPPAMRVPFFVGGSESVVEQHGDHRVVMHRPGSIVPGHGDHGYGPLAAVAESTLPPGGTTVPMTEHRNEEIISWVPEGVMRHDDDTADTRIVDAEHLLVTNTGQGTTFGMHTLGDDPTLRMLQVYVRPSALDVDPLTQHGELPAAEPSRWRLLVGPDGEDAPYSMRNAMEMHVGGFSAGATDSLPRREGWHRFLFVFSGEMSLDEIPIGTSGSALIPADTRLQFTVSEDAVLACFLMDPRAKVTRAGTVAR